MRRLWERVAGGRGDAGAGQGRRPICRHRPAGRASQRGCRPGVFGGREVLTTPSRGREGKYYCGVVTVASWPGPSGTARMVWVVVPLSTTSVSGGRIGRAHV